MTKEFENIPKHIAIIMDGNGRWANNKEKVRSYGHNAGVNTVIDIVEHSRNINIEHLTLYAFSTENWKRPQNEIDFIMNLIVEYIDEYLDRLISNGVKVNVLGDYSILPQNTIDAVKEAIDSTKENNDMDLNIALNYGGRDEIIHAVKNIARKVKDSELDISSIDEDLIASLLYTSGQPDPDLIIRTGAEKRLSNFLTWQSVYSELYFTDILWPDFTPNDLDDAIKDFQKRKRRYGGLDG